MTPRRYYTRAQGSPHPGALNILGPKPADHPTTGQICPACGKPMAEGSYTTLVPLGPGDDPNAQRRCRMGRVYTAVAVEIHWACATGE